MLLPTIVIYEVYKKLFATRGSTTADRFLSPAFCARVVGLDPDLATATARVNVEHRLPMADAIIYATAQMHQAQVITSDPHFSGLPSVTLI